MRRLSLFSTTANALCNRVSNKVTLSTGATSPTGNETRFLNINASRIFSRYENFSLDICKLSTKWLKLIDVPASSVKTATEKRMDESSSVNSRNDDKIMALSCPMLPFKHQRARQIDVNSFDKGTYKFLSLIPVVSNISS